MRSSKAEKDQQMANVEAFRDTHAAEAKSRLKELQKVARERKSTFAALMEPGKVSVSRALRRGRGVSEEYVVRKSCGPLRSNLLVRVSFVMFGG